jgi:hypothetical protein
LRFKYILVWPMLAFIAVSVKLIDSSPDFHI